MVASKWCEWTAKELKEGKVTKSRLARGPGAWPGDDDLSRWARECRDPRLKRLNELAAIGKAPRAKSQRDSQADYEAAMQSVRSGKFLKAQERADRKAVKQRSSNSPQVIKKVCQTAVNLLQTASKESNVNPHIQIWNNKRVTELHSFLSRIDNRLTQAKKLVEVYNAFIGVSRVKPSLAASNPKLYAAQMGNAMAGLGRAMKLLPVPFNAYGTFLEKSGKFFVNMCDKLLPGQRRSWKDYRPGGRFYNPHDRVFTFLKRK